MMRIGVITQDIRLGGGVFTKLTAFLRFAEARGYLCDVYYPAERPSPSWQLEQLRAIPSVGQVYAIPISEKVPHFARASFFGHRCRFVTSYDAYQLISGGLVLALPFVHRAHPFVAWVAGPASPEIVAMRRTKLHHYYLYNTVTMAALRRQEIACGLHARIVLTDSRYSEACLIDELQLPCEKLRVLTTPVDQDSFQPGTPVTRPRRYVLSVSRLARGKGFPTLLRAFREVARYMDDVDLWIAGDGAEREALERMTRELGLEHRVVFLGDVHDQQLIDTYRGATLFVLPSHLETLSIVVLEAMACGLPVIATACGGPADHVHPGETGFLVPVEDWRTMSRQMLLVLRDPDRAERMGRAARNRAVETFSTEIIHRQLDALYAEVFGMNSSRTPIGYAMSAGHAVDVGS
ncbi:MAG TPA: glycosyltransferase family 4 protein [Gemmatimonadaceae bacterium]